jgi:succinyl-CoA---D-citramalate CoA-transferase
MVGTDLPNSARNLVQRERPLEGLRVLELGSLIAGPFAARIMAEFGAEVIKAERPGMGDPLRTWRYVDPRIKTSLWSTLQFRNKKLITLDLRNPDGLDLAKRLAGESDILIENFKPGTLEKLGLGWKVLHELNPRLILVRVSGYGQTGPYKDRPGFANIGEAMGGIRYVTGEPDRPRSEPGSASATRSPRSTPSSGRSWPSTPGTCGAGTKDRSLTWRSTRPSSV